MSSRRNPDLAENSAGNRITAENTTGNGVAPQITSTIGIPEPPPEVVEATGAAGAVTILNPNAPVNRLSEGGIVFAYPDLVYSQFIDIDQQIEVTDDTSPGAVVLQIPYHPISDYTNQFIKSYARMHDRYNGDLIFRAQIIGNTTFSGTLMWFWWPQKYPTAVATMADAMKYSYKSQSIQFNSVEELLLHDARQYLYYRDMAEDDISSRPHLVLIVHTTIQSPLRDGIKIRIRIGSRLASASPVDRAKMATPFIFANPIPIPSSGNPGSGNLNGKSFRQVFPHLSTDTFRMMLDGNTTGTYNLFDALGHGRNHSLLGNINGISGRFLSDPDAKDFLYAKTQEADNLSYIVYTSHQLQPADVVGMTQSATFRNLNNTTVLQTCSDATFVKEFSKVYATRNLVSNLEIDTGLSLVQQTTCYTNKGKVVIYVVKMDRASIVDFANMGFPNISGGTKLLLPHSDVLGPTNYTDQLTKLPANWVSLKITNEEPSIVASNADIAPTSFTDVGLLAGMKELTTSLVEDQVLQFDLIDSEARVRIATLRFIPGRQEFVVNPSDGSKYKIYAGDMSTLLFGNYGVQPASAAFPITDTTNWLSRLPSSALTQFRTFTCNPLNVPNSAVGELLTGLSEGLDSAADFLSGSKSLLSSNNGIVDPVLSQDWVTSVNPLMTTIEPRMNVNIPLMNQVQQPTWTSARTPGLGFTSEGESDFPHNQESDPLVGGSEQGNESEQQQSSSMSPQSQLAKSALQTSFKALGAMSIAEITHLVTHQLWTPNGNVVGSAITSGINWGHDVDITNRIQSGQRQMQQTQNTWQNQQNQNSYANQQKMQGIDISNRQAMQQAQFGQETRMQQAGFGQQTTMQGALFGHENSMQQANFGQQTNMSNLDFSHSMAEGAQSILGSLANTATGGLFGVAGNLISGGFGLINQSRNQDFERQMNQTQYNQNLTLQHNSIIGDIANTATGGIFGAISNIASSAVTSGVNYLEQGRDMEFQKQMQTNNFNNAIYASGNSASAMKIATPS